jgi:hypothetical protein
MGAQAQALFGALAASGRNFVVIAPNNDPGSQAIFAVLETLPKDRFRVLPSMRFAHFSELMKNAACMVGNSSAGVREAPFLGLPSLDIGTRQSNRSDAPSVVACRGRRTPRPSLEFLRPTGGAQESRMTASARGAADRFVEVLAQAGLLDPACRNPSVTSARWAGNCPPILRLPRLSACRPDASSCAAACARARRLARPLAEKLGQASATRPKGRLVWLHAVGLGEVLALRGLIAAHGRAGPGPSFLVTSTTRASAEVLAGNLPPRTTHQFLPLDAPRYLARFLDTGAPRCRSGPSRTLARRRRRHAPRGHPAGAGQRPDERRCLRPPRPLAAGSSPTFSPGSPDRRAGRHHGPHLAALGAQGRASPGRAQGRRAAAAADPGPCRRA